MFADSGRLHIAVQKSGRLAEYSRDLLRNAGLRIQNGKTALMARVDNFPIDLMFVRDDDIPRFVADGVCEFGIVGRNVLEEFELGESEPLRLEICGLGFGRCALRIAAADGTAYAGPESLRGERIATSYPRLLRRFLAAHGVDATAVRMSGAVELAPRLGTARFICDLVSTGATLEANGLMALDTVLESEAVLIGTRCALSGEKEALCDSLLGRVRAVLASQESKYIMMNAPESALGDIAEILPGASAPTVLPLAGRPGQVAVHALCNESVFWETLQQLKDAGASAILVLDIEKMMM